MFVSMSWEWETIVPKIKNANSKILSHALSKKLKKKSKNNLWLYLIHPKCHIHLSLPLLSFYFAHSEPVFSSIEIPFTPRQSTPCVIWEQFQPLSCHLVFSWLGLGGQLEKKAFIKEKRLAPADTLPFWCSPPLMAATTGYRALFRPSPLIYICSSLELLTQLLLFLISVWGHWS